MHKLEETKGSLMIALTAPLSYAHLFHSLRECPGIVVVGSKSGSRATHLAPGSRATQGTFISSELAILEPPELARSAMRVDIMRLTATRGTNVTSLDTSLDNFS